MMDRQCLCGGKFVEVIDQRFNDPAHFGGIFGDARWCICDKCGGALTNSGKYLPPRSGFDIPALDAPTTKRATGVE